MVPRAPFVLGMTATLLMLAGGPGPAVPSASAAPLLRPDTTTLAVDSSRIAVRRPSDSLLAGFSRDPAYDYRVAERWRWREALWRWLESWGSVLFGDGEGVGWILTISFYGALALIIGYAAYMLVRLRSTARAPVRSGPSSVAAPQTAEEMRALDFEERLERALADDDYRRAVRLLYLQTLQRLDQAGTITWRPSTTNRAYVEQLDGEARPAFADLTRLFERIWYGAAPVDADRFEHVRARFEAYWDAQSLPAPDAAANAPRPVASA